MIRRARFIAGIFGVLALTFSFGESVWASTCAPGMAMGPMGPMGAMGAIAEMSSDQPPAATGCMHEPWETGDESGDCPFSSPGAIQACFGVVTLPAQPSTFFAPSFEGAATVFTLDTRSDLLLESTLFHPPRA